MQLRKLNYLKMLEGLKYPSSFLKNVTLDTTVEEYRSLLLKERIYEKYNEKYDYDFSNPSINSRINTKEDNLFDYIYSTIISYKKSSNFLNNVYKFEVIKKQYDALVASDMYDESICKLALLKKEDKLYLAIHFPIIFLTQIDSSIHKKIEIRDLYLYVNGNNLNGFRTTLDSKNKEFIHPHLGNQHGNFCLGQSPLRMSLDVLVNFDNYNTDDADIFWVNLYRTITQKTSEGAHYFDLDRLSIGREMNVNEWSKIKSLPSLYDSIKSNMQFDISEYNVTYKVDIDQVLLENYEHFSSEGNELDDYTGSIDTMFFNNRKINKIKYVTIYKGNKQIFSNAKYWINSLCYNNIDMKTVVKELYNAYKEESNKSDNSGATSATENQVFEFQML